MKKKDEQFLKIINNERIRKLSSELWKTPEEDISSEKKRKILGLIGIKLKRHRKKKPINFQINEIAL